MNNHLMYNNRLMVLSPEQGRLKVSMSTTGRLIVSYETDAHAKTVDLSHHTFFDEYRDYGEISRMDLETSFYIELPKEEVKQKGLSFFHNWEFTPYEQEKAIYQNNLDDKMPYNHSQIMLYDGDHHTSYFNFIKLTQLQNNQFDLYWESYFFSKQKFDKLTQDKSSSIRGIYCDEKEREYPLFVVQNTVNLEIAISFKENWTLESETNFYETRKQWVAHYFDLNDFEITEQEIDFEINSISHEKKRLKQIVFKPRNQ